MKSENVTALTANRESEASARPQVDATGIAAQAQSLRIGPTRDSLPPKVQPLSAFRARANMAALSEEILDHIASYLDTPTLSVMSKTCRALHVTTQDRVRSAQIGHDAQRVETMTEFEAVKKDICTLRSSLQAAPLLQLGLQIHALRRNDRKQAIGAFHEALRSLRAKKSSTPEVEELGRIAAHPDAEAAAKAGENILVVAKFHGIPSTADHRIRFLEGAALNGVAGESVERGGEREACRATPRHQRA